MCDGVGECTCWGADPRALLCSDLFGHVSMTAWGAECSAVLAVVWACECGADHAALLCSDAGAVLKPKAIDLAS